MRNIYDIFEERKFDVFYIENFSFNDLEEIDMVFENMERIFINDEYLLMEDFKEKMQDIKDKAYLGMQNLGEALSRLINSIIVKFNTKFQPVKKHIEKVGVANIIKGLEGRKVRMPQLVNFNQAYNKIRLELDEMIKEDIKTSSNKHYNSHGDFQRDMDKDMIDIDSIATGKKDAMFEGKLDKQMITTCLGYVMQYDKIMSLLKNYSIKAKNKFNSIKGEDKNNVAKRTFNHIKVGINRVVTMVNKVLLMVTKLVMGAKNANMKDINYDRDDRRKDYHDRRIMKDVENRRRNED